MTLFSVLASSDRTAVLADTTCAGVLFVATVALMGVGVHKRNANYISGAQVLAVLTFALIMGVSIVVSGVQTKSKKV